METTTDTPTAEGFSELPFDLFAVDLVQDRPGELRPGPRGQFPYPFSQMNRLQRGLHNNQHGIHARLYPPPEVLNTGLHIDDYDLAIRLQPLEELPAQHPHGTCAALEGLMDLPNGHQPDAVRPSDMCARQIADPERISGQHRPFLIDTLLRRAATKRPLDILPAAGKLHERERRRYEAEHPVKPRIGFVGINHEHPPPSLP